MAKKAIAFIEVEGGQEITRYAQIHLKQKLFGHHEFSIQVPIESIEGEGVYTLGKAKSLIGKIIRLGLTSDLIVDVKSPPFVGIITKIGFVRSYGSSNQLLIQGKSTTALLDNGRNFRSFSNKSLADIISEVMQTYPGNVITCNPDPVFSKTIPYLVQYNESDFAFLQRIANRYGEWMYFNGEEVIFGKPELPEAIPLVLGRDLYDFQLDLSLTPTNYQTSYYDYSKSDVYGHASLDSEISNLDPAYGEVTYQGSEELFKVPPSHPFVRLVNDQNDLEERVKTHVDQLTSGMVYMKGNGDHIGLGIGRTISVTGTKAEDVNEGLENFGEFIVTEISHYIGGKGNYFSEFIAIPKEVGVPPVNITLPVLCAESEPAVVKENIDPEKLGRVRVQLYWQKDNEMTPWIRLASSHGGAKGGFYVIPEKGDEVMVTYQHNHPDRPFVIGSVYNKNSKPANNWIEEDNNLKAIKTKSGNEIILNDKGGTEEIKILNKGGTNSIILTMSDGGAITVTTPNQMTFSAKNVTFNVDETLLIKAKNMKVETSENFEVKATKNIDTHSDGTTKIKSAKQMEVESESAGITLKSNKKAELKSSNSEVSVTSKSKSSMKSTEGAVELTAMTSLEAKAGTSAKVSGASGTNIESTGAVIVKGSVVQLN